MHRPDPGARSTPAMQSPARVPEARRVRAGPRERRPREAHLARDPDPRSAGFEWATRVTSIGLEFAVPAALGHGLDRWLGTGPWLAAVGALLGMAVGMLHVFRLPAEMARDAERRRAGTGRDRG